MNSHNRKNNIFDGLFSDNTVLSSLMVISPIIVKGNTVMNAIALIYAFSAITFISIMIGSFISAKLPYAVKIIINSLISSIVYVPVKIAAEEFFPEIVPRTGIYFMLIAVNSLITIQAEAKFYTMSKGRMMLSLIFYILGFDIVMLLISSLREFLAYGTVLGYVINTDSLISGIGEPFGGFILLGVMCGIYRCIRNSAANDSGGAADASDS